MDSNDIKSRQLVVMIDSQEISKDKHISVRGRSNMVLNPDAWVVDIYDITNSDFNKLSSAQSVAVLGQGRSTLCVGKPLQVNQFYDETSLVTRVLILDGDDAWQSTSCTSIAKGSDLNQALRSVLGSANPSFRTSMSFIQSEKTIRGISFFGRTLDFMKQIAEKAGMILYSFRDTVYMQSKLSAYDITLTQEDIVDAPQRLHGGYIVKTPMRGYFVGRNVVLNTGTIHGTFRLVSQIIDADNTEGQWSSSLILANEKVVQI